MVNVPSVWHCVQNGHMVDSDLETWSVNVNYERGVVRVYLLPVLAFAVSCANAIHSPPITVPETDPDPQIGCDSGDGLDCFNLGQKHLKTDLVSDRRARHFFRRSCELKYGQGCFELARLTQGINEHRGLDEKVRALYRKACRYGFSNGCRTLAVQVFIHGTDRTKLFRATTTLGQLCLRGNTDACIDHVRGRFILGKEVEVGTLKTLGKSCNQSANLLSFNPRACVAGRGQNCPAGLPCPSHEQNSVVVEEPPCPAEDEPWLVSAIHSAILECDSTVGGTITLRFSADGRQTGMSSAQKLDGCLKAHVTAIRLMAISPREQCQTTLRF